MKRADALLALCIVACMEGAACDPVPVAELTLALRQPIEGNLLAEPETVGLTILVDERDLGSQLTAPDLDEATFTVPLARDDEDADAEARVVSITIDVDGTDTRGLGRSGTFTLPTVREAQDTDTGAISVRVPVVLGLSGGRAALLLDDLPGARTAPVVCSARDGSVYLFGGTVADVPSPNGYLFDPATLDASTTIAFVASPGVAREVTGCDVTASGRLVVVADGEIFAGGGQQTPQRICAPTAFNPNVPAVVRASGDVLMVATGTTYAIVDGEACGDQQPFATAYAFPHVVAIDGGGFAVGDVDNGWSAFDSAGERRSSGTLQFLAAGANIVVTATQDPGIASLHAPAGAAADLEFDKIGDITVGTATVLAVTRAHNGVPVVLVDDAGVRSLIIERGASDLVVPLDTTRDAIGVTVGGAVLLMGGGAGIDGVVIPE